MKKILLLILFIIVGFVAYNLNFGGKKEVPEKETAVSDEEVGEVVVQDARTSIIGKWQSNTDSNFTREFESDGTALDTYSDGEASDQEILSWSVFDSSNLESGFTGSAEEGSTYLSMSNGRDSLYFKIVDVTDSVLKLQYLDRNEMLTFKKVR